MFLRILFVTVAVFTLFFLLQPVMADDHSEVSAEQRQNRVRALGSRIRAIEHFTPGMAIGDGKNGAKYGVWKRQVKNRPIAEVTARLRRVKGNNETYVNLRFDGEQTFENGKRVYLYSADTVETSWDIGGQSPSNRALVMQAYNGEVVVESVDVRFDVRNSRRPGRPEMQDESQRGGAAIADSQSREDVLERCRNERFAPPRIDVGEVRSSGGFLSGKYRVNGSILGACIEQAGYYEQGQLDKKIETLFTDRFRRTDFSIQVRSGRKGVFRVLTTDGQEAEVEADELIKKKEGY